MRVQAHPRISAEEFLARDHPIGSELIDGVVHIDDATFRHNRIRGRVLRSPADRQTGAVRLSATAR